MSNLFTTHLFFPNARQFSSALCAALLLAAAMTPQHARAISPALPPTPITITAVPGTATPGVHRVLRVFGLWNDACPPVGATVLEPSGIPPQVLTLRMLEPQTLVACAQVQTLFNFDVGYTPVEAGTQRVIAVRQDGRYLGEGRIVTATTSAPRGRHNLTGIWYDTASNGSGLALYHSHETSDILAGSWYLFDNSGVPRWYTIQAGTWSSADIFRAVLIEARAPTGRCSTQPACPVAAQSSSVVAEVVIEVFGENTLIISAFPATSPAATSSLPPLFSSALRRLNF